MFQSFSSEYSHLVCSHGNKAYLFRVETYCQGIRHERKVRTTVFSMVSVIYTEQFLYKLLTGSMILLTMIPRELTIVVKLVLF